MAVVIITNGLRAPLRGGRLDATGKPDATWRPRLSMAMTVAGNEVLAAWQRVTDAVPHRGRLRPIRRPLTEPGAPR